MSPQVTQGKAKDLAQVKTKRRDGCEALELARQPSNCTATTTTARPAGVGAIRVMVSCDSPSLSDCTYKAALKH